MAQLDDIIPLVRRSLPLDSRRRRRGLWLPAAAALALLLGPGRQAAGAAPEYQIKAIFVLNFAQFVDWPPGAFAGGRAPLVVGILGADPFDGYLTDAVRGERVADHPLVIEHFRRVEDVSACQILFISDSETPHLDRIFAALKGRSILTVGDAAGFSSRGGMIGMVMANHRIRLQVNVDAARASALELSSGLLRLAEIVHGGGGGT